MNFKLSVEHKFCKKPHATHIQAAQTSKPKPQTLDNFLDNSNFTASATMPDIYNIISYHII